MPPLAPTHDEGSPRIADREAPRRQVAAPSNNPLCDKRKHAGTAQRLVAQVAGLTEDFPYKTSIPRDWPLQRMASTLIYP
jgi:hypothetical protein